MIGLLQSGTGSGRGRNRPIAERGSLDLGRVAAPEGRDPRAAGEALGRDANRAEATFARLGERRGRGRPGAVEGIRRVAGAARPAGTGRAPARVKVAPAPARPPVERSVGVLEPDVAGGAGERGAGEGGAGGPSAGRGAGGGLGGAGTPTGGRRGSDRAAGSAVLGSAGATGRTPEAGAEAGARRRAHPATAPSRQDAPVSEEG